MFVVLKKKITIEKMLTWMQKMYILGTNTAVGGLNVERLTTVCNITGGCRMEKKQTMC